MKECFSSRFAPKDVMMRIAKSRARHTLVMEKALMTDDIHKEESWLRFLTREASREMLKVKQSLSKFDFIRFCMYIGQVNNKKTSDQSKVRLDLVKRLKKRRYGSVEHSPHVTNLSSYQLSSTESEVLAKGLNFAIPPRTLKRESVLGAFETFWAQLENVTPHNEEMLIACIAKLCDIAHAYSRTPIESKDFSLTREHVIALSKLRKNKDIVICKPDKGSGVNGLTIRLCFSKYHCWISRI